MHLLYAKRIEKSFGNRLILRDASLRIEAGERVGLVGANGAGKSTLLKILIGEEEADHGDIDCAHSMSYCAQEPILEGDIVQDVMDNALSWHHQLLSDFEDSSMAGDMDAMAEAQERLDLVGWDLSHRVDSVCTRVKAPALSAALASLSGGEQRRLALARALLEGADLMIFDEPTNHLDAETIEWFEGFLRGFRGGVLLVTHDRYLLEAVATRIVEIEDGECVDYPGSYADYLIARAERQAQLAVAEERRLRLIAQEAEWASRSPAARTTKQKARLQRLDQLLEQRPLAKTRDITIGFKTKERFGSILMDIHGLSKGFGNRPLFENLRLPIAPGDRIGIIGPNGCGKSTLLKIIAGTLEADSGEILKTPRLTLGMLDQQRSGLKEGDTVFEAAGNGNDWVHIGEQAIHVIGFLQRFLFGREHLDQQVSLLSGGERARLLMAKLMLQDCALLMLDEPTNDLDLLTLRALESALLSFEGAVIFVTHDRALLDRVCTKVVSFEGDGQIGIYADRQQAQRRLIELERIRENSKLTKSDQKFTPAKAWNSKLKKELESMPDKIEALENEIAKTHEWLSDPAHYKGDGEEVQAVSNRLQSQEADLEYLYARWEELSEIQNNNGG